MEVQWDPQNERSERTQFDLQYKPANNSVINLGYRYERFQFVPERARQCPAATISRASTRSICPGPGRSRATGVCSPARSYDLRDHEQLERSPASSTVPAAGGCAWGPGVSSALTRAASDTGVWLQLELSGLAGVGSASDAFLTEEIRGYTPREQTPKIHGALKAPVIGITSNMRRFVTLRASRVLAPVRGWPFARHSRTAQTRELPPKGELLDRIAAIVNDGVVLTSELDAQVHGGQRSGSTTQNLELPPENVLRQQVLERLVLQEIQLQRATHVGIKVSDEHVNAAMEDVAQAQRHDALAAARGARHAGHRLRHLPRARCASEITLNMLRQRDVIQHISVTPREIDQFLEKQAKTPSAQNEYNVSHILIAVGAGSDPGADRPGGQARHRRRTSAPAAARTSPSSPSPIPTARPRSRAARSGGARAASCRPSSPTSSRRSSRAR